MQNDFKRIQHIRRLILNDLHLGIAIHEIRSLAGSRTGISISNIVLRLEDVEKDYELMKSYLLKGFKDPKQSEVYQRMLVKLFRLNQDLELALMRQLNPVYSQAAQHIRHFRFQLEDIRENMEGFVQDIAMLSLESADERAEKRQAIHEAHQRYMSQLFELILVSPQWNDGVKDFAIEMLLSPTIDANDARLAISAIMLSNMNVLDVNKLSVLVQVYLRTKDEYARQRALVGWAFSLPSYLNADADILGIADMVRSLLKDEQVQRDLLELQMQVFYCKNTERDSAEIERNIIPNLMKNNNFRITRFGITEKEEDPMEDILNPGAADQKMEELENTINKVMDMQRKGTDIYFGGFSQMKRFAFFSDLSNWFVPFYSGHPGLKHVYQQELARKILKTLYEEGPFCDSDEYSFALGLSHMIQNLPPQIKEVLGNPETIGNRVPGFEKGSPTYIRRMYLQDLYRFFRVYPQRNQLVDPFCYDGDEDYNPYFFANPLLKALPLVTVKELERFLMKQKLYQYITPLCEAWAQEDDVGQMIIDGYQALHLGKYGEATSRFLTIAQLYPDNLQALKGLAQASFHAMDYGTAESTYRKLVDRDPGNRHYLLNLCISQISNEHEEEGVSGLYKLDYESPDEPNIQRALAWGLMAMKKNEQAGKIYDRLLALENPVMMDYLNAGYCKWFQGEMGECIRLFKTYLSLADAQDQPAGIEREFQKDRKILERNAVSAVEQKIVAEIVGE